MSSSLYDVFGISKSAVAPSIERNLGILEIKYKWADSTLTRLGGLSSIAFGSIMLFFLVRFFIIPIAQTGDLFFLAFTVPFVAIISYFIYRGAAMLLNHGRITVDGTTLVSTDRPIPMGLTVKVPISDIRQVYPSFIVHNTKGGYYKVHVVRVVTNDGRDKIVDKGISEGNAQLFASEISNYLGLADQPNLLAKVEKDPERLAIEYRPMDYFATSGRWAMFLFGIFWMGFTMTALIPALWLSELDPIILLFMLFFLLPGIFLLYYPLGRMLNRRKIIVEKGFLVAKERPLPIGLTKRIRMVDIQQVILGSSSSYNRPNNQSLMVITMNNKQVNIAKGLSQEQALKLAEEINGFLVTTGGISLPPRNST